MSRRLSGYQLRTHKIPPACHGFHLPSHWELPHLTRRGSSKGILGYVNQRALNNILLKIRAIFLSSAAPAAPGP